MTNLKPLKQTLFLAILLAFFPLSAYSQADVDIMPAQSLADSGLYGDIDDATHPPVRLTPDKSELLRLEQEAGSIIIGNPEHLNIMADAADRLVLVPRLPGATYITILDRKGGVIMQRHVIVASPKEKYVRIRRSCASSDDPGCQATQVFYCPDMCHEIRVVSEEPSGGNESSFQALEELIQAGGAGNNEGNSTP